MLFDLTEGLLACPFTVGPHGTAAEVDAKYRAVLRERMDAGLFTVHELAALDGQELTFHRQRATAKVQRRVIEAAIPWAVRQVPPVKRDFRFPAPARSWLARHGLLEHDRVVICGPRQWRHPEVVREVVESLAPGTVVIEGEAGGVDRQAADVAIERGLPLAGFPARWEVHPGTPKHRIRRRRDGIAYDAAAGPIRNGRMLGVRPTRVIALTESLDELSTGTGDCVEQAQRLGIEVVLHAPGGERRVLEPAS